MRLTYSDRDGVALAFREWLDHHGSWWTTFDGRSMEPSILSGCLLVVEGLPEQLLLGDLLVFVHDLRTAVCCHRVIALHGDGRALAQGDNVEHSDGFIDPSRFVGVVRRYRLGGRWYVVGTQPKPPNEYRRQRQRLERLKRRFGFAPQEPQR